jgi:hypothetical protein
MNAAQNKLRLSALGPSSYPRWVSTTALGLSTTSRRCSNPTAPTTRSSERQDLPARRGRGRVKDAVDLGKEAQNVLIEMTTCGRPAAPVTTHDSAVRSSLAADKVRPCSRC